MVGIFKYFNEMADICADIVRCYLYYKDPIFVHILQ